MIKEGNMRVIHRFLFAGYFGFAAMLTMGCGDSLASTGPSDHLGAIDIRVATLAAANDQDQDGYLIRINGGPDWPIGINGTRSLGPFQKGTYQVLLTGLAAGCSVDGANPRWVDVIGNNSASHLAFTVTCLPTDESGAGYWDY
jgi:hypothetical protein